MSYGIIISKSVQKQIGNLPSQIKNCVIEKIQSLAQEPRPSDVVKLKGSDQEYRIRLAIIAFAMKSMIQVKSLNSCSVNTEEMSIEIDTPTAGRGGFLLHRPVTRSNKVNCSIPAPRSPQVNLLITGCPTAITPRFSITFAAAISLSRVTPQYWQLWTL